MGRFRVVAASAWLLAATAAHAACLSGAAGELARGLPSQALLSVHATGGAATAVRTGTPSGPTQDAQGLVFLAVPVDHRLSAVATTAERSGRLARQASALPHPQRGPPLPA